MPDLLDLIRKLETYTYSIALVIISLGLAAMLGDAIFHPIVKLNSEQQDQAEQEHLMKEQRERGSFERGMKVWRKLDAKYGAQ